jgi:uncharacterized protein (TIGR02444 family)
MKSRRLDLWTFSLAVYNHSAVQRECLDLQDRYGVDINLLLFCAFVGVHHGAVLSDSELRQAAHLVAVWHEDIVSSLRRARRALKPFATDFSLIASSAEMLRNTVKATELEGERLEQAMLEMWAASRIDGWHRAQPAAAIVANIHALFAIVNEPRPSDLPNHLIAAAVEASHEPLA